tara:strand:+ start:5249 stop:5770 length:522 start_codon:yes stop_codon:yes gene_type:complete
MYDTKNELLLNSLMNYFDNKINMTTLVEVLQDRSLASLRMIDWFVTKYSKQYNISYIIDDKLFNVYMNYKSQLKAYSKKQMDPFCRRERIILKKHGNEIITTIGQMNFFRWAIENRIIKFIYENYDEINKLMKVDNKIKKVNKQSLSRKKSHIPISNKKSFTREKSQTILRFD